MIYFDNAATGGVKPPNVIKAVNEAITQYSFNPGRSGYKESLKTAEKIFNVRQKVAEFFGSKSPEKVIFTLNCTQSINMVLKGVLKKGDHIIVSSLEHNAVMRPLKKMGISFDVAEVSLTDNSLTVERFREKIKPHTRMIFCTAASNVWGKILPLEKIGALAKERGILFGVDAAQGGGIVDINVEKMHIDFLCVAPHKGLYAPMGVGILILRKPLFNTLIEGGTGTNSLELVQPKNPPERYESGTVNVVGIMGIGGGVDFINSVGREKIYRHEMELIGQIYKAFKINKNIILYTPYPKMGEYAPVLSFNVKGENSNETAAFLAQNDVAVRGGYHCAPFAHTQMGTISSGAVRISLSAFNNETQVMRLLRLLKEEKNLKKF